MKKKLLFSLALICSIGFFSSCSDDDEEEFIYGSTPVAFNGNKLDLTYSGAAMPGKKVTFSTIDGKVGQFVMEGTLDLKDFMGKTKDYPVMGGIAPGVFPGEIKTTIDNVNLTLTNNKYTFSGVDSQNGRSFAYEGSIDTAKMVLKIKDVKFPQSALTGKWNLVQSQNGQLDGTNVYVDCVHYVWEAGEKIELFPGFGMEPGLILGLAFRLPIGGMSPQGMLNTVLRDVDLREDGNVVASYKKALTDPEFLTSPLNIAQYYVTNDNSLRLFLNPNLIIENVKKQSKAIEMPEEVISGMVTELLPLLSAGIPLKYKAMDGEHEGQMAVYADIELIGPLFKVLKPLLQNEDFINSIIEELKKDPEMASMADMVGPILIGLPKVLDSTTKMELGIYLVR